MYTVIKDKFSDTINISDEMSNKLHEEMLSNDHIRVNDKRCKPLRVGVLNKSGYVLLMPISTDRKLMELPDRELLDIMTIA